MNKSKSIFQASVLIVIGSLSSRILGFIREILIAKRFGVSAEYDIFLVATTIPIILVSVFLYAIPGGFIPQYLELKVNQTENSAERFYSNFLTIFLFFFLVASVVLCLMAPVIMRAYFPTSVEADLDKAIYIFRIASFFVLFGGIFSVVKSVLTANKIFLLPAFAPGFHNISIIFFIISLSASFGIFALVIGFLIGYFIQMILVLLQSKVEKIEFSFLLSFKDRYIKKSFPVLFLVILINFIGQLYTLIDRSFNASLPIGAISGLNYAMVLNQIVVNLIGVTLGTAIFPSISEFLAANRIVKVEKLLMNCLKFIIILIVPMSFFVYQNSHEIIIAFFKRGSFDDLAVKYTFQSFQYYSLGFLSFVSYIVLANVFYSLRQYKYILFSSVTAILFKILFSILWTDSLLHIGLAASTSISVFVNVLFIYSVLNFKFIKLKHWELLIIVVKVFLSSCIIFILQGKILAQYDFVSVYSSLLIKTLFWLVCFFIFLFLFKINNPLKLLGHDVS